MQRVSLCALRVMRLFDVREALLCGADVMSRLDLSSGTVYPLLARLKKDGLLSSTRERGDPRVLGRPLRTLYSATEKGRRRVKTWTTRLMEE